MKLMKSLRWLVLSWALLDIFLCDAYRILGVFPFNVKSHFIMFERLMKGLAERGHRVDVASQYPLKQPFPNYTDVIIFPTSSLGNPTNNVTLHDIENLPVVDFVATVGGNCLCEQLGNPKLLELVRNPPKDQPYDLVITEIFGAQCFIVLGKLLKTPVIGISSSELYPWMNDIVGNPENLAWVPNNMIENVDETKLLTSIWWRLYNTMHTAYLKWYFQHLTKPQDDIIKKYFGPEMPGVRELERSLSLILTNSHASLTNPKPITPALIEVGGLHIQDDHNELPSNLKKWLDTAEYGFIYVSLGTMVKIESFPKKTVEGFFRSFGKIAPVRVVFKITNPEELFLDVPENIITMTWAPQTKILSHPKIKAFVTHGGLMGTQEAIFYGIPMIGIPLFADQFRNIANYVSKKIAIKFDLLNFSEEQFDLALHEIMNNSVYKNSIKRVSEQFQDRPLSPLNTACYWVEYVIKHGEGSLKSAALDLTWWQIALLDVYGLLLLLIIAFLYFGHVFLNKLTRAFFLCNY